MVIGNKFGNVFFFKIIKIRKKKLHRFISEVGFENTTLFLHANVICFLPNTPPDNLSIKSLSK